MRRMDTPILAEIYDGHASALFAFLLNLTRQEADARDVLQEVFAKLAMTEALLTESKERPAGRLKVTTTTGFGSVWLAPRLRRFMALHPDVTLTILLDDADLDLAMREADVAIRMHPPRQPDLIQRNLGSFGWRVCGAPDYLKTTGMPSDAKSITCSDPTVSFISPIQPKGGRAFIPAIRPCATPSVNPTLGCDWEDLFWISPPVPVIRGGLRACHQRLSAPNDCPPTRTPPNETPHSLDSMCLAAGMFECHRHPRGGLAAVARHATRR